MTKRPEIVFAPLTAEPEATCLVLVGDDVALGARAKDLDQRAGGALVKAAEAAQFKGKKKSTVELLAPPRIGVSRLVLLGTGKPHDLKENDWILLGGSAAGAISARKSKTASIIAEVPEAGIRPENVAALLAFGAALRQYEFRKYLTTKKPDEENAEPEGLQKLVIHAADPDKARAAFARYLAVANGVVIARDLVNEPANALGPVEFAERVRELEKVGVEVEILDAEQITELKMGALLAVAQGSVRPARVAILQWHGAKSKRAKPLAFIGKGVVFDTGGISIKPAAGMEDMKGDMGGAACVVGLMHALAERKANVNVVGLIGLVENMPSGTATRPGDIVTRALGPHGRDPQYRRRGSPRAGRPHLLRAGALQAAPDRRPRHAHRRHHGGARQGVRRPLRQRRQARQRAARRRSGDRARRSGACRSTRPTTR